MRGFIIAQGGMFVVTLCEWAGGLDHPPKRVSKKARWEKSEGTRKVRCWTSFTDTGGSIHKLLISHLRQGEKRDEGGEGRWNSRPL